jgi:NTE family protein
MIWESMVLESLIGRSREKTTLEKASAEDVSLEKIEIEKAGFETADQQKTSQEKKPQEKTGLEKTGLGAIRKPTIGLALGGGAARGFAHIGIVRTLIANGIVPDIVVGTSIGAVVGGCYAAGHLDTLEAWARGLQPKNLFSYLDIRLNGSGLIGGNKLAAQLEASIGKTRIDELPLKFAAIATEIQTGHEIWLTHGRVVDAMRASYALPGIFSPVAIGDRWLIDGALVNPVPVSAARALGAEIVIAANVSTDVFGHGTIISTYGAAEETQDDLETPAPKRGFGKFFSAERTMKREFFGSGDRPGISKVMVDAFNIMQDRITRARLAGDPPDVLISPRVGKIGWFDFHRAEETIAHGTRAAERTIESIQEAISILSSTSSNTPGIGQNQNMSS